VVITRVIYLTITEVDGQPYDAKIRTTWGWTVEDEYAVNIGFHCSSETKTWVIDRQIVLDGVKGFGGVKDLGDFTIDSCRIEMRSPDGTAVMRAPRKELQAFAKDVGRSLPAPRLPADDEIARVMAGWVEEYEDPLWWLR
jgi:hypothetical protein